MGRTFDQGSGGLVCIDICATFMNCILNFARGEKLEQQRGELPKYLSCQLEKIASDSNINRGVSWSRG